MTTRAEAVEIAKSWLGTPYVLGGRIKGAGCDCATLLAEYLIEIGAAPREDLGVYSHDWFCHASSERYLLGLLRHATATVEGVCRGTYRTEPGNVALFRVANSQRYNHGAVLLDWPFGIHACTENVQVINLAQHPMTSFQHMAIFEPKIWSAHADR